LPIKPSAYITAMSVNVPSSIAAGSAPWAVK